MSQAPARAEDIAAACAELAKRGPFPDKIAEGLAACDAQAMCEAVFHLLDAGRTAGLREVIELFRATLDLGDFAALQSSRLHRLERDFASALADLEDLFARRPEKATVHWFAGRARCLENLDRFAEAEAVAREGAARFPNNPPIAALLAHLLARRAHWPEALAAWDEVFGRFAGRHNGEMYAARALALLHLGRIEEAIAALEERLKQAPDDEPVWRSLADICALTGDGARRTACLEVLTGRLAAHSRADRWAELARARHDARDFEGGAAALAELERRFPDSALAERERLRLAYWLERGQDELTARTQRAVARFPGDAALRGQWVLMLLAQGRLEAAEAVVKALEAEGAKAVALAARLALEADRGGDAHLRVYLETLAKERDWRLDDAIAVAEFLLQHRAPWGFALADDVLGGLGPRAAGNVRASVLSAKFKIALREDEAASAIIAAIPAAYARPDVNELRAWAAQRRGGLAEAQAIWRRNLREVWFGALDCPIGSLERLSRDLPPPEKGVTAFVVYRNEAPQLPGFLAHHRRIGVRRFVFVDHMSSDESCVLLLGEPDVVLYQSRDSYQFSSSGRRWVAEIVAKEGSTGWGLQVDPDEYFIYPGWETAPLDRLLSYLDARGFAGMRAYMLDMFATRLVGEDGEPAPLSAHCYYDDDYAWIGQPRPPYLSPVGGVRQRLFGAAEFLHKTPLWRLDAGQMLNSHETTPLALADVSGALLHYKLFNMTLRGRSAAPQEGGLPYLEADTNLDVLRRHSRYAAKLETLWRADLFDVAVSRALSDSLDMTARGLMTASTDYRDWLRA